MLDNKFTDHDSAFYAQARDLHFGSAPVIQMVIDLEQGQERETDGPETELAYADFFLCDQQRVIERVSQVSMRDADQTAHSAPEALARIQSRQAAQVAAFGGKHFSRQPAGTPLIILPHILQNVCHLQALAE